MTVDPRTQRLLDQIDTLLREGEAIASTERAGDWGGYIPDSTRLHAFETKAQNVVDITFGTVSLQARRLRELSEGTGIGASTIAKFLGYLRGARDDLRDGFVRDQTLLIAGELFDSVLDQAKHLHKAGHSIPAAVLARIVLEDALQRVARDAGIDDSGKASVVNDRLKSDGRLTQPQWRQVQVWLDIGNAAAHGTQSFSTSDVPGLLDGVLSFLSREFT